MSDLVCVDCGGKKAAAKPKSHYYYDYVTRLIETNKQLLEACKGALVLAGNIDNFVKDVYVDKLFTAKLEAAIAAAEED